MGSGRGYSFDVGPKPKPGKDMRYEQKSFTVKGAGHASIWRKCNHCDRDLLGEDSLAEHLVLQHNEPLRFVNQVVRGDEPSPDDEGHAKRNQDFSLEG
jgi:hypothetical protein